MLYYCQNDSVIDLIKKTQLINPTDYFSEQLALTVLDDKYYQKVKEEIAKERITFQSKLKKNNINYFDSDANFF